MNKYIHKLYRKQAGGPWTILVGIITPLAYTALVYVLSSPTHTNLNGLEQHVPSAVIVLVCATIPTIVASVILSARGLHGTYSSLEKIVVFLGSLYYIIASLLLIQSLLAGSEATIVVFFVPPLFLIPISLLIFFASTPFYFYNIVTNAYESSATSSDM